ncbi:ribonucleoside-triphosphate reductase [Geobacter sulfurreducens]|nr:ribonucleoside-triphosphate reductase [Geobacter sulfurreducens]
MLEIGGLLPFTTINYPGKLSAVIFCQGCPWRCGYCHNRHLIPTMSGAAIPWLEIVALLRSRCGLLDAVVFSGGEPTMQAGLPDAMRAVRGMGFKVGLHTAGSYPERLHECLSYLDWVGMDLKAPFEEYEQITGIPGSGEAARQSAELLRQSSVSHQFRTTVDPFLENNGRIESMLQLVEKWGEELKLQQIVY